MSLTNSQVHYHILRHFVDSGHAPSIADLALALHATPGDMKSALVALQEYHGVVLHPGTSEIWTAHPFSAAPTNFWVTAPTGAWWANCAWCAMGVVALVGGTATVTTTLGAESKQVTVRVIDGVLQPCDLYVHFPVPMARAWENVVYTCSTMLLFESASAIADWCARHRIPLGDVQPLSKIHEFAKAWYGRHLQPDWTKWSAAQALSLFERFNLVGPIWQITPDADRF